MIWCLLAFASAHEVAVFSEDPLPNSRAVFGEAGELLEARTGVPLTGWQWVEASQLSQGRLGVARREPVEPPLAHHDYAPATPVFASDWHAPAPAGLGVAKLWAWPVSYTHLTLPTILRV